MLQASLRECSPESVCKGIESKIKHMVPRRTTNSKRKIQAAPVGAADLARLSALAARISYGGNLEHKRNPGDFGLQPPSMPRIGKSLCDDVEVFSRTAALDLLKQGAMRGLVSVQIRNHWPQNIWSVAANGIAVEAMLENAETGHYHGYPMAENDPLGAAVIARWIAP